MKIAIIYIVVILAVVGVGFWLFNSSNEQQANLPGQAIENQGQTHIPEGSTDHPAYSSNPPTSGWHWAVPAAWGAYDEAVPDEKIVHNLEHGGIWISFKPENVSNEAVTQLKDFANRYKGVIIAPREQNDSPIALAAWGRLQKLEQYDENAIIRFIEAFYNKGPEKVDL